MGKRKRPSKQSSIHTKAKESPPPRRTLLFLKRAFSSTRFLSALGLAILGWIGGYADLYPHISIDPGLLLNPGDPFSTQFTVTNENPMFDIRDLQPSCRTIYVITTHNVGLFGLPPRPSPPIPTLGPKEKSTIDCLPILGGLGAGAGDVMTA